MGVFSFGMTAAVSQTSCCAWTEKIHDSHGSRELPNSAMDASSCHAEGSSANEYSQHGVIHL